MSFIERNANKKLIVVVQKGTPREMTFEATLGEIPESSVVKLIEYGWNQYIRDASSDGDVSKSERRFKMVLEGRTHEVISRSLTPQWARDMRKALARKPEHAAHVKGLSIAERNKYLDAVIDTAPQAAKDAFIARAEAAAKEEADLAALLDG